MASRNKRERKKANQAARRAALEAARKRRQQRRIALFAGLAILVVVLVAFAITLVAGDDEKASPETTNTSVTSGEEAAPCPAADGSSERRTSFKTPFPDNCTDPTKTYTAVMETDAGVIKMALDTARAPKTVNNFVSLARYHFYDDSSFHRVIKDYVIQGGLKDNQAGYSIPDEFPAPEDYKEGGVALANTGEPNSGSTDFFILTSDAGAAQLRQVGGGEAKYALFAQVTEGIDVVKKIEADANPANDRAPLVEHKIVKVTIEER